MTKLPEPIVYGKMELAGIMVRPDSRAVMKKAVEGYPVDVSSGNDYINLYHVFERMQSSDRKGLGGLQLIRRQISHSRWRLFVVKDVSEIPEVELDQGYDPKRGRYKRYAEQLAAGEAVVLSSRAEAIKARRAWQLYVPAENRRRLRSTVRAVGKSGRFVVTVLSRD